MLARKLPIFCVISLLLLVPGSVGAKSHWFSGRVAAPKNDGEGERQQPRSGVTNPSSHFGDEVNPQTVLHGGGPTLFDVVISLHNSPQGDSDGNSQGAAGSEEQDVVERIIQHFADGVFESTEGAHKIRNVRIFTDGAMQDVADVIWEPLGHPQATRNGIAFTGGHIYFFDEFENGVDEGIDYDLLFDEIGAGYTLAHEWGHYAYGLGDEYRGTDDCATTANSLPCIDDDAVMPSMMSSQWNARGGDTRWLNFSIAFQGDPAGDFENTRNTAHHRSYSESGWETLARTGLVEQVLISLGMRPSRTLYPELAAVAPTGTNAPTFPNLPGDARADLDIMWMQDDQAFMLVIDKSGSMAGQKINDAKTAAKLLVDLIDEGKTSIGVIAFEGFPRLVFPLTAIEDEADKDAVKAAIDTISAGGGTAVGAAVDAALDELTAPDAPDGVKAVFLLSDGISGDNSLGPLPGFVANQIPIFAFSYGNDADVDTLREMADVTGGTLCISPVTLAAITACFQDALDLLSPSATIATGSMTVDPLSPLSLPIVVDSTLSRLTVVVTHSGGVSDADFELRSPDGTIFNETLPTTSGNAVLRLFSVDNPVPGEWSLLGEASFGAIEVSAQATGLPTGPTFSLSSTAGSAMSVQYPSPIVIEAAVARELPVVKATVTARIIAPDGSQSMVNLLDDGQERDVESNDGIYTNAVGFDQNGLYEIVVRAVGEAGFAELSADMLQLSAGVNGELVPPPPNEVIAETFERSLRIQVTTQGAVADDHGNAWFVATLVRTGNEDFAPGIIETPGDVDVFRLNGPPMRITVVRLTGFAMGMNPSLVLYSEPGRRILAQGTMETHGTRSGSLALPVVIPSGAKLFAEVAHVDGQNGTGIYQISAGPVLDVDEVGPFPVTVFGSSVADTSEFQVAPDAGSPPVTFTDSIRRRDRSMCRPDGTHPSPVTTRTGRDRKRLRD